MYDPAKFFESTEAMRKIEVMIIDGHLVNNVLSLIYNLGIFVL